MFTFHDHTHFYLFVIFKLSIPNNNVKPVLISFSATFNAALDKDTAQSSTEGDYTSDRAVDGSDTIFLSAGSCSQTTNTKVTWWYVDLGRVYTFYSVTLTNRLTHGKKSHLLYFIIMLSNLMAD